MKNYRMLVVDQLSAGYNEEKLFWDLNFTLAQGAKMGISGRSGCGKSTLLRILLGFESPRTGRILWNGEDVTSTGLYSLRNQVFWLPQGGPHIRGKIREEFDTIFHFRANRPVGQWRDRFVQLSRMLDLDPEVLERESSSLSGGERQRLGWILCALLDRPLNFLDEPVASLDEGSVEKTVSFLEREIRGAAIVVSHNRKIFESCGNQREL